jgi:hypothetical protein
MVSPAILGLWNGSKTQVKNIPMDETGSGDICNEEAWEICCPAVQQGPEFNLTKPTIVP